MDSVDYKNSSLSPGSQMSNLPVSPPTNGNNAGKKRRKGTDLKPIVTNESAQMVDPSAADSEGYVFVFFSASFSSLPAWQ